MSYGVRALLGLAGLSVALAWPLTGRAETKHPAEEKGIKSVDGEVEAKIEFENKSGKTVKVYWLDYEGNRQLYQTLKDGESHEQETFLTHPWLITDEDDNAWYLYFPDAQPRSIEIVAPAKKE